MHTQTQRWQRRRRQYCESFTSPSPLATPFWYAISFRNNVNIGAHPFSVIIMHSGVERLLTLPLALALNAFITFYLIKTNNFEKGRFWNIHNSRINTCCTCLHALHMTGANQFFFFCIFNFLLWNVGISSNLFRWFQIWSVNESTDIFFRTT